MSLAASFTKAKADIADAASRNLAHARPSSTAPARTSTPKPAASSDLKRGHDSAFASSAPSAAATAPLATGQAGGELMTNVVTAIRYLKEKDTRPVAFEDIVGYLSLPNELHKSIPRIKMALQTHPSVEFIPKAASASGRDSFKYRPKHPVASADDLRDYLARQPTAQGIIVSELKDGWPDCLAAVNRLEAEGAALVRRHKDDSPRCVWADSPTYHLLDPVTGRKQPADDVFCDYWRKIKLPPNEMDMRLELEKAGLTPTSQVKEVRIDAKKKEKRRIVRKNGKTTNSHMMGILKDYDKARR